MRTHLPHAVAAAVLLSATVLPAAPIITEFLASNATGIQDEDLTRPDWIEIHNPDGAPVDLGGYHLTDDVAVPAKWTFPAGVTLNPGAYLVVFASSKDRAVAGQNLHTNFALSAAGEYLALNAPGGTPAISEWNTFPVQTADVSYGLLTPVAGGTNTYFNTPTPGAVNNGAAAPADPVEFSLSSRTFNQGTTLTLTLSTPSPTDTIRYTINRSRPISEQGVVQTVTVNAATDTLTCAGPHGFTERDFVQVDSSTTSFPGGIGQALNYFVIVTGANTLKLSETAGGTPLDITSAGGGVITVRRDAARFTASTVTPSTTSANFTAAYHNFNDRDAVQLSTTGTLPAGLSTGTTYYVNRPLQGLHPSFPFTANTAPNFGGFSLSATPGGALITVTNTGTGTHTVTRMASPVYSGPITVSYSQQVRARAFETGRPYGPIRSEGYLMLDAAAQAFTSNVPVMILHSFGSYHPTVSAGSPEDTKRAYWFVFEPKVEVVGQPAVTRLTNLPDLAVPGQFERRGSSTFGELKYSMTMGALSEEGDGREVSPLGFANNDDFVLNAHYTFDRSLMHNDLIYRLSNEAGRYAPHTRHVEVFMSVNNDIAASGGNPAYGLVTGATTAADYYGVFSFQDKIRRGDGLVPVEKMTTTDNTAPNVQGGYIFKIDRLDAGDAGIAAAGRSFALVQPKEYTSYPSHLPVMTTAQKTYLSGQLNSMWSALQAPNFMDPAAGYAAWLDVPAAIDHWWLSILPKSADAFRLSGYWHKSRFGKIAMGPIFDFDRAMGSTDGRDINPTTWRGDVGDLGTNFFSSSSPGPNTAQFNPNYFQYMFNDPNYWQATIDRYEELRKTVLSTAHVHAIIDEWTEMLDPGNGANTPAKRNFLKFTGTPPRGAAANTPGTNGTFRGETQWLKNWWGKAGAVSANGRFDFVDGQFIRPAMPSLPEGPVPAGSAVTLTSPSLALSGTKIYYTTDGTDPRRPATAPVTLYSPGPAATLATFLPDISTVRAIVPNATTVGGATGVEWRGVDTNANGNNADDFDDSGWFTNTAGTVNGVGYDNDIATSYLPYIGQRWSSGTGTGTGALVIAPNNNTNTMFGTNGSCFSRWAFTLTAADITTATTAGNSLVLNVRYDDAIVAWINGTRVAFSDNVAAPDSLLWNSVLGTSREAVLPAGSDFDITVSAALLHPGTNLLAIQALNGGSTTSSDLVVQPRIIVRGSAGPRPAVSPELTAGAVEYTAPLNITAPTQIFARTFIPVLASDPPTANGGGTGAVPNGSSWSAPTVLYYFPGAAAAAQANVQITEVFYHPAPPTSDEITAGFLNSNDFEFIRLTNTGAAPVDLTGIYFSNGLEFTAVPGLQNWLPAGASVVVVENTAAFISRYGTSFTILGEFQGELDDGGEHIVLNDKTGAIISDFIYGDGSGPGDNWPTAPDNGYSLVFVSGDQNLPGSWRVSSDPGGTAVNTFARWQRRYFASGDIPTQDMAADTDGDGLNNLGEYAFGTDPRSAGTAEQSIALAVNGQPGRLSFRRRTGTSDLTWTVESSTDLGASWTPISAAPLSTAENGDDTETLIYDAPGAPAALRIFMRARVTNP